MLRLGRACGLRRANSAISGAAAATEASAGLWPSAPSASRLTAATAAMNAAATWGGSSVASATAVRVVAAAAVTQAWRGLTAPPAAGAGAGTAVAGASDLAEEAKAKKVNVIGIRREDKNRWERRAPLTPLQVQELTSEGIQVVIQPSTLRIWNDEAYRAAGAEINNDLTGADVILGVKEVPPHKLIKDKTFMFFAHVMKGQERNMPILDEAIRKNITLIDYESVADSNRNRLVRFGAFAGYAGMIDFLHILGNRFLSRQFSTPFLHIGYSHMYPSLASAKHAVDDIGGLILNNGLPEPFAPLVFVFVGTGPVAEGAVEIFKRLPHKMVERDELELVVRGNHQPNMLYGCVIDASDYVVRRDGQAFDWEDYRTNPREYKSVFASRYLPFASVIVNCSYWDDRFPRILQVADVERATRARTSRLIGTADISCDVLGALETTRRATTMDEPAFVYDTLKRKIHDSMVGDGIVVMAVDNLPSEFPKEASRAFGETILPFVREASETDFSKPIGELGISDALMRGTVAHAGALTPQFEYLNDLRVLSDSKVRRVKKILVLGSGMVAEPLVEYLARYNSIHAVTIASHDLDAAKAIKARVKNTDATELNVMNDDEKLRDLVHQHDIVVSFVPASLHVKVARVCVDAEKHLVTASYTSPEMAALHEEAKAKGVTILNEMGLDPGIDHMSAMKIIHNVQKEGGRVASFESWCGGVPAPECSDNAIGYKFSWSPAGVFLAATNDATYLENGEVVRVPGEALLSSARDINIFPGFHTEGYANRNSLQYIETYGLEGIDTMLRGTIRYKGYCEVVDAFRKLGLLDKRIRDDMDYMPNWGEVMSSLTNAAGRDVRDVILERVGATGEHATRILQAFDEFEMLSDHTVPKGGTALDKLSNHLRDILDYEDGERDLCLLHHIFQVELHDGREQRITSTLAAYGDPMGTPGAHNAMAKTVGLPAAIGAKHILNGTIVRRGCIIPNTADVYNPVLYDLASEGIVLREKFHG